MSDTVATKGSKLKGVTSTLKDAFVPTTKAGKIVAYSSTGAALVGSFVLGRLSKKKSAKK